MRFFDVIRSIRSVLPMMLMVFIVDAVQAQPRQEGFFIAYETLEMSMNQFRNFAGEAGYRFGPRYRARLTVMEVDLTERHLSSKWEAAAVDGHDVEGYMRGYEVHVDRFFAGNWYVSGSAGYYEDDYRHRTLGESLEHRTFTVGSGIGYSRSNLLGIPGMYVNFDIPVRYYFNHLEETRWGETTIRPHIVVNNIWIFVGYKF